MEQYLFFESSKSIFNLICDLFDFIWPTSLALWNQRFMVNGFLDACPNISQEDLNSRFAIGSEIKRLNLKKASKEKTWEEQKADFARILLIDIISLYESWIAMTLEVLKKNTKENIMGLQYPSTNAKGYQYVLNNINNSSSQIMSGIYYSYYKKHKKNSEAQMDNLLITFRMFKEMRNSIVHGSGIADSKAAGAYNLYINNIHSPSDLLIKEMPEIHPIIQGKRIDLSLRGVVGFSEIIHRIIATLDAECMKNIEAEKIFINNWKTVNSIDMLPSLGDKRLIRIKQLNRKVVHFDLADVDYVKLINELKVKKVIKC